MEGSKVLRPRRPRTRIALFPISAAENYAAETIKRKCEIDDADYGHSDHLLPNNGQPCAAIEHILCEHNEMRRWANHVHDVLQPNGHAFHWRAASGKQHHHQQ